MSRKRWMTRWSRAAAPLCALVLALPSERCASATAANGPAPSLRLTSSAFQDGGTLPVVYTCDGDGHSPPLAWTGAPAGTAQFALLMTTLALDGLKWNWVLYGIPATAASLAEGAAGVGVAGPSSDGPELRYYPPCSQGPGAKTYTFTLYALSAAPAFGVPAAQVSGPVVTAAIAGITLDSARLGVSYSR
jgi:phosphatidylethanolamine-binding protein (PEBP) family uncharacterized protein